VNLEELQARYSDLTFEEIAPNPDWNEDTIGYCFVVEAIPEGKRGRVTVMVDDLPRVAFTGDTVGLFKMLTSWEVSRDHLAYLSYELGRAEMAVRYGLDYLQE
jgi:hypothetical protein